MTSKLHFLHTASKPAINAPVPPVPQELIDAVEGALNKCFEKEYILDELLGEALTQLRGPLDSLSKLHGYLIEEGIAHGFVALGDRFDVLTQVSVPVPKEALSLVEANKLDKLEKINFPLADGRGKRVSIDILVFDHETGDLHVVSVKRGGGAQGGQAARDARKDLSAAGLMLKNLMLSKGYPVLNVKKVLVDWYGRSGIIARKTVTRETIDDHFGIPIAETVEAMSRYMSAGINERLSPRLLEAATQMCSLSLVGSSETTLSTEDEPGTDGEVSFPEIRETPSPGSLAECLSVLPSRRQGRQMRQVN